MDIEEINEWADHNTYINVIPVDSMVFKKGHIPWNNGKKLSKEHCKKLSESHKGQIITKETRKKLSESMTGENNHFYGKKHSNETKMKISVANTGNESKNKGKTNIYSEKTLKKMSLAKIGKETWMKGKKHTEKSKQKIREKRLEQVFPLKDSKPERFLQSILSVNNIEYTKHKPILGQPDIFIEPNICVFVDGCYWHGCKQCGFINEEKNKKDDKITDILNIQGYKVIRIWEHVINNNLNSCLIKIKGVING